MGTTQRMLPVMINVADVYKALWGAAEDGALNGGTRLSATVDNKSANDDLTVQISVQATPGSAFVPNATTVKVVASTAVSISITGLSGYAMRLEGKYPNMASGDVETSVQIEQ